MDIGKRIADARILAGVTQQELAEMLFVSRELVSKWESGLRRPDLGAVERIARALSVPVETIITREECVFTELQRLLPHGEPVPRERLSALISRFLRERPEKEADVFIRKYYLLNSTSEIAAFYGIGENHVRSLLSKSTRRLGKFLKEELAK